MATTSPSAATPQGNGAGAPDDAVDAFLKAASSWPSTTADPNVPTAFELGWLIRTLKESTAGAATDQQAILLGGPAIASSGIAESGIDRERTLLMRIQVLTRRIQRRLVAKGEAQEDVALLTTADATDASSRHATVLEALHILDASLADAYSLGRSMRATYREPAAGAAGITVADARQALAENAVAIDGALSRLASKLPPNAAQSVRHSLALWAAQLERLAADAVVLRLPEQVERWRSMLKGDIAAKDLLRASDYVGTVEGVMDRLGDVARASMRRKGFWILVGVVVLLLVITIVLFALGQGDATLAGIGTLIAAAGLSWKGIGEFFGRAAAKGEKALWDAQLDWTIAYRCTLSATDTPLPAPADSTGSAGRLAEHVAEWEHWLKRWPDLDSDAARPSS